MKFSRCLLWGLLADWLGRCQWFSYWQHCWLRLGCGSYSRGGRSVLGNAVLCGRIAPLSPITDALALESVKEEPEKYGDLRLWGSVGYMVGFFMRRNQHYLRCLGYLYWSHDDGVVCG